MQVLAAAGARPQHRFGQNFMIDQRVLSAIVEAGQLSPGDTVLEVGPGVGHLTSRIAARAGRVLAVDIDEPLMRAAANHWCDLTNIRWLHADALAGKHKLAPQMLDELRSLHAEATGTLKLIANLPYNAASPLIAELLTLCWHEQRHNVIQTPSTPASPRLIFERLIFTVQWEVAQRMAAPPDCADYGALGILLQLLANVRIIRSIEPGAFWPPPKVRSALVEVIVQPARFRAISDIEQLTLVLRGIFAHRRQNLVNAIRHGLKPQDMAAIVSALNAANINPASRSATLTPSDFIGLSQILAK